jgi:acetyltransferase-like isoleucine patch superfamily enzyme
MTRMSDTLHRSVEEELTREGARTEVRVLRAFYAALDRLVALKRDRFKRVLPLADYLVDRWDKARVLGFGEGTSVYDSCLVIGDVKVGKACWIGPYTILDGSGGLEIGDHCTVSAGVHVYSHDNIAQTLDPSQPIERTPVKIGSNVYLGPHTVVARGVTIGDRVVVGANSLVTSDLPSGCRAAGNPARVLSTK